MTSTNYASDYILVHFNGGALVPAANVKMAQVRNDDWTRATVIDGTLFIFAEDDFRTVKIDQ
jgi:hypothetical protein